MRLVAPSHCCLAAVSLLVSTVSAASSSNAKPQSSQLLSETFSPPLVFKHVNLMRNVNLEKGYAREKIDVVIENIANTAQDEYWLPFSAETIGKVGAFEVRDKKNTAAPSFKAEPAEYDPQSTTQFYRIRLPTPLAPSQQQTLSISYAILSSLTPLPAQVSQTDKQYLVYSFSAYVPSAYVTLKQKTKLKFASSDIPDFTHIPTGTSAPSSENTVDPIKQGTTMTYGAFGEVPAGVIEPVTVRYEYTKPVNYVNSLERDLEVSHWGGNLATEERYELTNIGAALKGHFNRVQWAATAYYNPPTSALRELKMSLKPGSLNPYFVDDIGNVSTSRFRSNAKEAVLELKPRYPVFGGWNYKFKVGWDRDLKGALRKLKGGDSYVLKVPLLEGARQLEGIQYKKLKLRVILPEGATNIKYETSVALVSSETSLHRTFMDTLGRTSLTLTAVNIVDDLADRDLIVTYEYPFSAGLRKPMTVLAAVFAIFTAAYLLSKVNVSIGKEKV